MDPELSSMASDPRQRKHVIVLGPPGAGKGTQCSRLAQALEVPHISSGDILRAHIRSDTKLGRRVQECIKQGGLIPDNTASEAVLQRIEKDDCESGFVLDGFPRTLQQAQALETRLYRTTSHAESGYRTWVIRLVVSDHALLKRLSARRTCPVCASVYNIETRPSLKPGVCDRDGSRLETRVDDQKQAILKRMASYRGETLAVEDYYSQRGWFLNIDGDRPADIITAEVLGLIMRS